MSIFDIINPWRALRDARWTIDAQTREIDTLYDRFEALERKARAAETDSLLVRVLRAKIEQLEEAQK